MHVPFEEPGLQLPEAVLGDTEQLLYSGANSVSC